MIKKRIKTGAQRHPLKLPILFQVHWNWSPVSTTPLKVLSWTCSPGPFMLPNIQGKLPSPGSTLLGPPPSGSPSVPLCLLYISLNWIRKLSSSHGACILVQTNQYKPCSHGYFHSHQYLNCSGHSPWISFFCLCAVLQPHGLPNTIYLL